MPGKNVAEVRLGAPQDVGGYAFSAPLGTTRPVTGTPPLDAAYDDLAYLSSDGIEVKTALLNMERAAGA